MSEKAFRLNLNSTYKESERIPDFVIDIQKKCGLSEELTSSLMLVLSEAVTNAIVHGNKLKPEKIVEISLNISPESIKGTVKDEGEGFKPSVQNNPLEEENLLKAGGRGVFLIQEISEHAEYLDSGTKLVFTIPRT